jgi:hypothetical protein
MATKTKPIRPPPPPGIFGVPGCSSRNAWEPVPHKTRHALAKTDQSLIISLLPLLVNAVRMIDGPLVSKIGLSERLAKIMSYEDQA